MSRSKTGWIDNIIIFSRLFHWAYHTLNKGYLFFLQPVFLVKHFICPWVREVLERDELINTFRCILRSLLLKDKKSKEICRNVTNHIFTYELIFKWTLRKNGVFRFAYYNFVNFLGIRRKSP